MIKIQEAWFEYRAAKSKEKELQMEPGFLTRLWPGRLMIYQNAGVGPTTRVARTTFDGVILRKGLGDHLRTSDKKTYLQFFDVKHSPGKALQPSFFAFRSEWGRSFEGGRYMDAGAPPWQSPKRIFEINPHLGRTAYSRHQQPSHSFLAKPQQLPR